MILEQIVVHKRREIEDMKLRFPLSKIQNAVARQVGRRRSFKKSLLNKGEVNIIAEIKKASPSAGIITDSFNPLRLAQLYEFSDATAISVVTESHFFKGRISYLKTIREVTARPILRKDFIIDRYQIFESALFSADAVLLIASLLLKEEIEQFIFDLKEFEIDALVEVHNEEDLQKALDAGAEIIGINNRNLHNFKIDLDTTERLVRHIPKGKVIVAESGIEHYETIQRLRSLGVNAFLVGTALIRAKDVIRKMYDLRGVKR